MKSVACDLTVLEIFQAYYDCRKCKRNSVNALAFEENLERNIMDLYYELVSQEYVAGRSIMFVITKPKAREVWAADFRDRIVHHVLYNRYSPYFYNRFIHDSYACIPNKGTLKAAERVEYFIKAATKNHTQGAWFLKADIANFFVSIDKSILDNLLSLHITDPWWLWLTREILHKDPTDGVYIKSDKSLLSLVPPHKSLLNSPESKGLPIGNLSSQFFANIYLNELDQYAKHVIKARYYARYVDDIVILGESGSDLNKKYVSLCGFVESKLAIKFHPNKTQINTVDTGVNFVGYIIKPYRKYLRRATVENLYSRVTPESDFIDVRPTVNSYFGMMRNANAYKERQKFSSLMAENGFYFDKDLTKIEGKV